MSSFVHNVGPLEMFQVGAEQECDLVRLLRLGSTGVAVRHPAKIGMGTAAANNTDSAR